MLRNRRRCKRVRVFNYHGVIETFSDQRLERNFHLLSAFRDHVRFFQNQRVIGLPELAGLLQQPEAELGEAVVITFDDGYRNNLLAAEILCEARLPWALFVSTGCLEPDSCFWPVELSLLLLQGHAQAIDVFDEHWELGTRTDRETAFQKIRVKLKRLPQALRMSTVDEIRRQFHPGEIARLLTSFPSMKMLSWDEVRQLDNVEIGSHGQYHEIHHEQQPAEVRRREMITSKAAIEGKLNRPCPYFAFPNGDYLPSSATEVTDAGYRLAFSTRPGAVERSGPQVVIPRFQPGSDLADLANTFYWGA